MLKNIFYLKFYFCQAQFQLASSVPVQLNLTGTATGTELGKNRIIISDETNKIVKVTVSHSYNYKLQLKSQINYNYSYILVTEVTG